MIKAISKFVVKLSLSFSFLYDKLLAVSYKKCMKSCGRKVYLRPSSSDIKGLWNMSIGSDVLIPQKAIIYCTDAPLTIGNHVVFGPSPTIMTGNHSINIVGKFITNAYEKESKDDAPVIIDDDVWMGANVTILMGVTVGRGTVVAAGAVVNKSCPPYSIIGGVPAKVLKYRFTVDQILEHEEALYPVEERYTKEALCQERPLGY